ncbi:MAG: CBS domain-containing protein [Desulfocapsaceae bacterium]|nr:CBS domain-containing protein [Desulfocapsaceae bacterium]
MEITLQKDDRHDSPIFSRLRVKDAMRHNAVTLSTDDTLSLAIRTLIKHKIDALLILDHESLPAGVVTKTELMGAYYAALPLSTQLGDIMASPVIQCSENDSLETALITMQQQAIHRVYVSRTSTAPMGALSYPDIVGTLYKFCYHCKFGLHRKGNDSDETRLRHYIENVMTPSVMTVLGTATIMEVIEQLSASRLTTLLVVDKSGKPVGVISKTDLILAYLRGTETTEEASTISNAPVTTCSRKTALEEGIRTMILSEAGRLFIHGDSSDQIVGVISLTDMARLRSGSCQACSSSRIEVKKEL